MTKYAYYISAQPNPVPVKGWIDTDHYTGTLPEENDLLEITDAQWDERTNGFWMIDNRVLVPYVAPPPAELTPADQAMILLNGPVTVVSANANVTGVYTNTVDTRQAMIGIVSQINSGLGVPGGAETFNYPDTDNRERQWSANPFVAYANAVTNFAYQCQQVIGGFSLTLPSNELDIDAVMSRRKANG